MQTLLDCRSCSGFVPPGAGACPCCGATVEEAPRAPRAKGSRSKAGAALGLVATGLMAVSLMACYGLPMCADGDKVDEDGDGYFVEKSGTGCVLPQSDCDDTKADVYPGADDPNGDGIDQNCDGVDGDASTSSGGAGGTSTSSSGGGGTGGTGGTGGMTGGTGGMTTSSTM